MEFECEIKFYTESSWSFLHMYTKSGQNGRKHSKIGKNSGSVQKRGQRT